MNDLSRLIDGLCAGLDEPDAHSLSGLPETLSGDGIRQLVERANTSWSFRSFRSENEPPNSDGLSEQKTSIFSSERSRATSSHTEAPERAETPEREAKNTAGSTALRFPVDREEPERPEREGVLCGRSISDLNRAAPQSSDWWTGPAMADADALAPAGDPLPISPADVRAGFARELHLLAGLRVTGPEAEVRAVEIVRAKVGNSPALAEKQPNSSRCHACGEPLDGMRPEIAVLNPGGHALHFHQGCHDAYRARRRALVARIMAAAGYGAEAERKAT